MNNNNNNNYDNNNGFALTEEEIQTIEKAALYLHTIGEFANWSANNIRSIDLRECFSIMEDFVKSNEHIIQRISKVKPSP